MRAALVLLLASATAHAAPCRGDKLAAATHEAWGVDGLTALDCQPLRAKHPLLLVQAGLDGEGKPAAIARSLTSYAAIVDPATSVVYWHRESYAGTPGSHSTFAIADLDRDGRDELLEHVVREGHEGMGSETLMVYAIGDVEAREAGTLGLAEIGIARGAAQNGCRGTWAIVGGPGNVPRIQVIGVRDRDPKLGPAPDFCPLDGTHRYWWTGAAFALAD